MTDAETQLYDDLTALGIRYAIYEHPYTGAGACRRQRPIGATMTNWGFVAPTIMTGRIEIDQMITHVMGLEEINKAFDLMHAGESIRSVVVF